MENLFIVSIGYRVPPLYRAGYTVGLVILLLTAFFLFDSLFSFKLTYWLNFLIIFIISVIIFMYVFYSVTVELPDDGKEKLLDVCIGAGTDNGGIGDGIVILAGGNI